MRQEEFKIKSKFEIYGALVEIPMLKEIEFFEEISLVF